MSVIQVERPSPAAPVSRSFAELWDLGVRLVLLAALLAGVVTILPAMLPQSRVLGQFLDDLKGDRVTAIRHDEGSGQLLWADGWLHWYRADVTGSLPALGPSPDGMAPGDYSGDMDVVVIDWVRHALDVTGRNDLSSRVDASTSQMSWAEQVPWHGLSLVASFAGLLAFVLMLANGGKRFGNRWAWFWVFVLGGFVGPLLYLALEPSPAWPGVRRPLPARPRFQGGGGFLIGLALKAGLFAGAVGLLRSL